jgi:hypothetical protein
MTIFQVLKVGPCPKWKNIPEEVPAILRRTKKYPEVQVIL